jgi:hypothetical protein
MLASVAGGAVRLANLTDDQVVGLAEGIETALAVMVACARLPVWATLSTSNLEQVALPTEMRKVVLLADHDPSGAGARAAETAAARLHAEGRRVFIAMPPKEGDDFNDLLLRDGVDTVRRIVEAAVEWGAHSNDDRVILAIDSGTHKPIGFGQSDRPRPQLRADNGDLARAVSQAWQILLAANDPPWMFRAAGCPTWVVRDDDGLPMAKPLTEDRLRPVLAQLADWRKLSRNGDLIPAHPPLAVIKSILATPDPALPVLTGIVTTPVFGREGELITEPGYHPAARLLYDPPKGFVLPPVPAQPTQSDIAVARSLLLDDLLGDFPFIGEAERAHALARGSRAGLLFAVAKGSRRVQRPGWTGTAAPQASPSVSRCHHPDGRDARLVALARSRRRQARLGARRQHAMEDDLLAIWHQPRHGASALAVCAELDRVAAQWAEAASQTIKAVCDRVGGGSRWAGAMIVECLCQVLGNSGFAMQHCCGQLGGD